MNWFKNLKILNKILTSSFIVSFLTLIIGVFSISSINRSNTIISNLYQKELMGIVYLEQANKALLEIDKDLKSKIISTDSQEMSTLTLKIDQDKATLINKFNIFKELDIKSYDAITMQDFDTKWLDFLQYLKEVDKLASSSKKEEIDKAYETHKNSGQNKIKAIEDIFTLIENKKIEISKSVYEESQTLYKQSLVILIFIILSIFILSLTLAFYTAKLINKPFDLIIENLKKVREGDLDTSIPVLYQDETGDVTKNLNNMIEALKDNKDKSDSQNWLKEGLNQLSVTLSKYLTLKSASDASISFLSQYLNAGAGLIYTYNKDTEKLILQSSYALTERESLANEFDLRQGIIGQAAYEMKPIILKNIQREDMLLSSGLISQPPINIYAIPLLHEDHIYGVVELGFFHQLTDSKKLFLEEANKIIANALNRVAQSEEIKNLLSIAEISEKQALEKAKESEEAKKQAEISNDIAQKAKFDAEEKQKVLEEQQIELERRAKEMQEINTQMEEQQQLLQQQTEEMRQSNIQLEDQKQQLQDQTEEVLQSNYVLEKQKMEINQQVEETKQINERLEQAKSELDTKAQLLEQSSQYKSEFLANMSHELRTPLNSVILLSQLLSKNKKQNLFNDEVEKLKVINNAGNELLRLINDILDLSKIEAGKVTLEIREFTLGELLIEQSQYFGSLATEKGLDFIIENNFTKETIINSDSMRISQILRNFLSNAFKFTETGSISIILSESGIKDKGLKISIKDSGIGIPKEKQALAFEAFRQVDGSTSRVYGGTGLGLTISTELSKMLKGEITLESEEGKGSIFSLIMPFDYNDVSVQSSSLNKKESIKINSTLSNKIPKNTIDISIIDDRNDLKQDDKVILIIEDDIDFANTVRYAVNDLSMKAIIAIDGRSAIDIASKYNISGIILDMGLPDISGLNVLQELKTTKELRNIPVHIISGDDKENFNLKHGYTLGFKQKPVNMNELTSIIKNLLNYSSQKEKKILIIEDNKMQSMAISALMADKGFYCGQAYNKEEAVIEINKKIYDAVIVDLGLGDSNGYELCLYIKNSGFTMPVIIYTGKDLDENETNKLKKVSDTIVIKTTNSGDRLVDEIILFLSKYHDVSENIKEEVNPYIKKSEERPINENIDTKDNSEIKSFDGKKILIVDDDIKNTFVLISAIEDTNAIIITAKNGREAIDILKENKDTNLILMDIMMPVMNGYEATDEIRKTPDLKHIPIIATTAKALKDDKDKCIASGANDYISKPIDIDILFEILNKWIDKSV